MKVLFVIHELSYADHISISYLSAIAKQQNHKTYFCSLSQHNLLEMVQNIEPEIIAYSVNIIGFEACVNANKEAKKIHNFISLLGGPQATFSPETYEESGMDYYCVGEGELAFHDFLEAIEKKKPIDSIPNFITPNGVNEVRPLISDLSTLPPADRDLVISNSFLKDVPKKTFYFTRGCPFKCKYCCNNYYQALYKGKGRVVRRFPVERMIQEMECVKEKYRMDFIKIGDDLFAMKSDAWLEEFAEKYSKRIGLPFNCFLRIDFVDDKLLKLLKKAGCYSVHLSLDSTSEYVREKILGRKMKKIDFVKKIQLIHDYGINTWLNTMIAVPESTLEDDLASIELCRKAKVTYPSYSVTVPMKGTDLYNYCVEKKYINPSIYSGDMSGCNEKPTLSIFSEREKNIRFNIYLLGAIISKLPTPLYHIAMFAIKVIPPNYFFRFLREKMYGYYIQNKIFKLPKE